MVTGTDQDRLTRARAALGAVTDPEIPVLTIADLGVLRDVRLDGGVLEVVITPTYSGCPAMNVIAQDIEATLAGAELGPTRVRTVLSPAWTTDWLSAEGRRKLLEYGIAPPPPGAGFGDDATDGPRDGPRDGPGEGRATLFGRARPACPRCGAAETEMISAFGSTACKALHRCLSCREPFDAFKCH